MTLAELQALAMRQAVAGLDRLHARQAEARAAEQDPKAERPRGWLHPDYLQEEIDDQALQIAKLAYVHEREQGDLDRAEAAHTLQRAESLARIAELEHLTGHRDAILAEFKAGNEIQRAGLAAIAEAIKGRA